MNMGEGSSEGLDCWVTHMKGNWIKNKKHHHHHHQSFMELGHLLTRSSLTHPEVSLTVYRDFASNY